jgi:repressor LexA
MERAYTPRLSRNSRKKVSVSYFGYTAAGLPKDIVAYPNQIIHFPISDIKGRHANYFSLTVKGTSMIEAGIQDGDYILLRKAESPENGAIMLVRHEDQSTVKRIRIKNGRYFCVGKTEVIGKLKLILLTMRYRENL